MKIFPTLVCLFLLSVSSLAQNKEFSFIPESRQKLKKEILASVKTIHDLDPEFAAHLQLDYHQKLHLNALINRQRLFLVNVSVNQNQAQDWNKTHLLQSDFDPIIHYQSVEILTIQNGKSISEKGRNQYLTLAQQNAILNADQDSEIGVKIKFKYQNNLQNFKTSGDKTIEGEFKVLVVPDFEAQFQGGLIQLIDYFNKKVTKSEEVNGTKLEYIPIVEAKFKVHENGKIRQVKLLNSTSDPKIDRCIIQAISQMPDWKPAANSKGKKVTQEIILQFGNDDGC